VREFHSDNNLSEIGPDEIIILECIIPEGFKMKPYYRSDIISCFLVGVSLSYDNSIHSHRIGDISIRMMFNNNFYLIQMR